MWIYYTIFFLIVFIYYKTFQSAKDKKYLLYVMLALGIFVGAGDMLGGYDRYIYGEIFDDSYDLRISGQSMSRVINMAGAFDEKGYMTYNYLLSYVTANRYIFILISSVFIFLSFFFAFKKYVHSNPIYALILFLGMFFFFTFTYLREVLAICISFWALKAVMERRFVFFLLIVVLAYTFHHSAILLTPIYFIPLRKWTPVTIIVIAVVCLILGVLGVSRLGFSAFSSITGGNIRAEGYANEFDMEGYFRIDYVMEAVFFLFCLLTLYHRVDKDKRSLVLLNYTLVFCYILLLFVRSPQGGRLSWYFLIGVLTLITEIVHKGDTNWRLGLVVVSFLLFNRIVMSWGILLSPYKTFLTDGLRENDPMPRKFEYDEKYAKDKFYRPPFVLFGSDDNDSNSGI